MYVCMLGNTPSSPRGPRPYPRNPPGDQTVFQKDQGFRSYWPGHDRKQSKHENNTLIIAPERTTILHHPHAPQKILFQRYSRRERDPKHRAGTHLAGGPLEARLTSNNGRQSLFLPWAAASKSVVSPWEAPTNLAWNHQKVTAD